MRPAPGPEECLAALSRLSWLQSRAVGSGRMLSLERVLRARQRYLELLEASLSAAGARGANADGNLGAALKRLMEDDERNLKQALGKLEEICGELKALRNREKLLGSYGA